MAKSFEELTQKTMPAAARRKADARAKSIMGDMLLAAAHSNPMDVAVCLASDQPRLTDAKERAAIARHIRRENPGAGTEKDGNGCT